MKKQVAKKPREHYNWCDLSEDEKLETPRWYCESCDGAIKENYSYCHDCGQAIDWRNEYENTVLYGYKVSKKFFERRLKDEYSVYIYNYRNAGNGSCNNVCIMQGK